MQFYKIRQKSITSFKKERKYEDKNARMKNSGISLKNTYDNKYNITTKLKLAGKAQAVIYREREKFVENPCLFKS